MDSKSGLGIGSGYQASKNGVTATSIRQSRPPACAFPLSWPLILPPINSTRCFQISTFQFISKCWQRAERSETNLNTLLILTASPWIPACVPGSFLSDVVDPRHDKDSLESFHFVRICGQANKVDGLMKRFRLNWRLLCPQSCSRMTQKGSQVRLEINEEISN